MDKQFAEGWQTLVDKWEITEVLYRYCHACDHMDEAALRSCFHPGATHDHGPFSGPTEHWITGALQWLAGRRAVTHMIANPLIRISGDRALCDCHFVAYNRFPKSADVFEEILVKGRYIDRFEKRDGQWKILHRLGIHDLERTYEIPTSSEAVTGAARSGPVAEDPYFSMLADFMTAG